MTGQITIVIADDHPVVRQGLRQAIEEDARLRIVAEVANGRAAVDAVLAHTPRIAVLDVDMPDMNGFDAVRALRRAGSPTGIVFLTMHRDEEIFNEALDLEARGFVLKDSALTDIVDCIDAVAANRHYFSHGLTSFLMSRGGRALALAGERPAISRLTTTEQRVLRLIADSLTSKDIGEKLFVSTRTVEKHRANICEKLDLRGSHALLKFALQHRSELGS